MSKLNLNLSFLYLAFMLPAGAHTWFLSGGGTTLEEGPIHFSRAFFTAKRVFHATKGSHHTIKEHYYPTQARCQEFVQEGASYANFQLWNSYFQLSEIFQIWFCPRNAHGRNVRQNPISSSVNWIAQGGAMASVALPLATSLVPTWVPFPPIDIYT